MSQVETEDPRVLRSRRAVINATIDLLSERGVAATTIEGVSAASGVAKTTIYRHWGTKSELIIDAFDALVEAPRDPDTGAFSDDLEQLAMGLASGLRSGRSASLLPSLIEAADRDPELAEVHKRFADARSAVALRVVQRARRRGEVRADVTDEEIVGLLAGPIFYKRMVQHRPPSKAEARRWASLVAEFAGTEARQ